MFIFCKDFRARWRINFRTQWRVLLESVEDEILLKAICDGHTQAYATLVRRHTRKFHALAYRVLGQNEDAEDVVQDAFLKLWQNPHSWSEQKSTRFTTWFYKVVLNKCLDFKRKNKQLMVEVSDDIFDEAALQDETLLKKQQGQLFDAAFQKLAAHYKAALHMCFFEHMSNQQAAEMMDMNLKAFQSLLIRAKQALREHISEVERGVI